MPTVLDLVGVAGEVPDGRSLLPFASAGRPIADAGVYFEALNASLTRHWAPLTGVVAGGLKFIDLPIPELYDLAADPGEQTNLFAERNGRRGVTGPAAVRTARRRPPPAPAAGRSRHRAAAAIARIRVDAGRPAPAAATEADDPKTLIGLHNALDEALAALKAEPAGRRPNGC